MLIYKNLKKFVNIFLFKFKQGRCVISKTYTVDFLTKTRGKNKGEAPQYYVEESHQAIIDKEMWEAVQLDMERKKPFAKEHGIVKVDYATETNPFAEKVIYVHCGSVFVRKLWNSTNKLRRRIIWRCNKKYTVKDEKSCENKHINDRILYQAFINTFNSMIENKDYFMEKWKEHLKSDNVLVRYKAKQFIGILKNAKPIKEFDENLFFKIVEKMTVFDGEKIIVSLLD